LPLPRPRPNGHHRRTMGSVGCRGRAQDACRPHQR
jgi:hypothetical protein